MKPTLVALFALVPVVLTAAPPSVVISFGTSSVTVSGVPPGHDVLLFSMARESRRYWTEVVRRDGILSGPLTDGGRTWDVGQPVPPQSIWCAIDLSNAEYVIAGPSGFSAQPMPVPVFGRKSAGAAVESIQHGRMDAMVLLVRPGSGAWIVRNANGGPSDADRRPGRTTLRFESMQPFTKGGPPPPGTLTPNDTLIVIDPLYMQLWSGRVGKEIQP